MRHYIITSVLLCLGLLCGSMAGYAEDYPQVCQLITTDQIQATFETAGMAASKKDVEANAIKSLFHTLFYVGIEGINNGKPLVGHENKLYTQNFFNDQARYTYYITRTEARDKVSKVANLYRGNYSVTIPIKRLISDMKTNKVYVDMNDLSSMDYSDVASAEGITLPTIIVVPYRKDGENFASILQSDFDRRVAVTAVQQGMEEQKIPTVDLQAKLNAVNRRAQYEQNSNAASSNDKMLLMTSGADVYVEVDIHKDIREDGARVSLTLKAYETATGNVLASRTATTQRRFRTTATDALANYAVQDNIKPFVEEISKKLQPAGGQRVALQFAIDGNSATTMNDPMGSHGYALSNIIRQWVRKNAFQGKFHLQGIVDESLIFDYVVMPPKDADGIKMDAAQFEFILEQYLKETEGIECSGRVDGNTILITIY